jgi:hypothetical protein
MCSAARGETRPRKQRFVSPFGFGGSMHATSGGVYVKLHTGANVWGGSCDLFVPTQLLFSINSYPHLMASLGFVLAGSHSWLEIKR